MDYNTVIQHINTKNKTLYSTVYLKAQCEEAYKETTKTYLVYGPLSN